MGTFTATFLSTGPGVEPETLTMPLPGTESVPPARIQHAVGTPDGDCFEVWERVELHENNAAIYRLVSISSR